MKTKIIVFTFLVGLFLGAVAWATLPNDLVARIFNSFVETDEGNVAVRAIFEN